MKRIFPPILAGVLAILLLISLNAAQRRTAAAELALTESTLAAVAEASAELESLSLALDKLLVTTSTRQMAALLSQIALSADRVQTSLAALPDAQGQRASVLAYLSKLSHLCQNHLTDLAAGESLSSDARSTLAEMRTGLSLLQSEMALAQADTMTGVDVASLPATELTAPPSAKELVSYKALPSREIGSGEAMQIAKEFVGVDRVTAVAHAPDTGGAMPAFGVTVQTADVQLNVEVTRRGGKILLMAPETASFPMKKTPEECSAEALAFLKSRGFAEMEVTYYQVYDGLCVLTCVYVQNGVLIWPDRVLVQVRMDTAEIVGIEARSYWKNHIPRKLQTPLLTESEARTALSPDVTANAVRTCLLPFNGRERLCWQFSLQQGDDTFISYIDAMTGEELLLEKVMQLEFGAIAA